MDEEVGDEVQDYNKARNDFKKDFIEKWLVNLSLEYKVRNNRRKDFDSHLTENLESDSASTSQIDFWDDGETDFRAKKKVSKLQFFNALKNIFKKKKGEFSSDDLVGDTPTGSTFNILSMGAVGQDIIAEVNDTIVKDRLINRNSVLSSDSNSQSEIRRDGGTQTLLQESVVRIGAPGASIRNLDTLDQFNRGFSEIIHTKNYFQENLSEGKSDGFGSHTMSETRCVIVDRDRKDIISNEINYHHEPKTIGDGWEIVPTSDYSCNSVTKTKTYAEKSFCPQRPLLVNPVDSYVNKLELIKTYFGTRSARAEPPKPKPSVTVIRVPLTTRSSSRTVSVADSCALTKDLTEAPYLREHERLQWQGRNRELWFRINALYQKYNRAQQVETEQQKEKNNATNVQPRHSLPQDVAPALEKIYYHTRGMDNRSESYFQYYRGKADSDRPRKNKPLPFGKSDAKRHVKLEEIFVTEHIRNHRGMRQLSSSPESCQRRVKQGEYYKACRRPKTQGWHCALEQVRASMQRMSDDEIQIVRSATISRDRQRCQSKISVALSSSDWEDVSTPSVDSSRSQHSIKLQKPLPNIPYTPSFRHHFRARY